MSSPYAIDNEGIGSSPFLTMSVDQAENKGFRQQDIDDNLTACVASGNNEVGMGTVGGKLIGKVVWVSTDLISGTTIPATSAVQMRGCARFKYAEPIPVINQGVCVNGMGKVLLAATPTDGTGQVIAVDKNTETCDVWLG